MRLQACVRAYVRVVRCSFTQAGRHMLEQVQAQAQVVGQQAVPRVMAPYFNVPNARKAGVAGRSCILHHLGMLFTIDRSASRSILRHLCLFLWLRACFIVWTMNMDARLSAPFCPHPHPAAVRFRRFLFIIVPNPG